jgi:HD-GYP domain-containing protein (c-di-GMP phosphodiesterase class II)
MKVKVNTGELRIGMYVYDLDRPWRETPFLFQGFEIRTEDEIRTLQQYCRDVFVLDTDSSPSAGAIAWREWKNPSSPKTQVTQALQFEQQLLRLNNHPGARPIYEDQTTLEEEIQLVRRVYLEAQAMTEELLNDARLGRSIDVASVRGMVGHMMTSVLRNPDALTCYAQLKRKDSYTSLHSLRSCILALIFGRQLGMPRFQLETLGMAGLLHDLGMVKVPDDILAKPEKLTPTELTIVRRHVAWGAEMLERSQGMPLAVIQAAREHHERFDGKGYPLGLSGSSISETGRIIGTVDYYDAVTSDRSYQAAISPYAALRVMYEGRTSLFDGDLVERFIQCLGIYPVGSVVELSTGEVGVVASLNRVARLKPRVVLVRKADGSPFSGTALVNLMSRRLAHGGPCDIERVLDPAVANIDPVKYLPISAVA